MLIVILDCNIYIGL